MNSKKNNDKNHLSSLKKFYTKFDKGFGIFRMIFYAFILIMLILVTFGGATALGYFASLVDNKEAPPAETMVEAVSNYNVTSEMYYASGELISDLRADLVRTPTSLDSVSPHVINGVIAIEDEYFSEHNGVSPKATLRALFQDLTNAESTTGGSTLTQQVVKQQLLSNEVTHERKATEILLAMQLEDVMNKEEILQIYLNVSPFGRNNKGENIAGIQEAATGIFGTQPNELNLPQAAFLAGLPQNPIVYSPYTNSGQLKEDQSVGKERQELVLFNMRREGLITQEEYEQAVEYDIVSDFITQEESDTDQSRSYVYDLAEEQSREIILEHLVSESDYTMDEVNNDENLYNEFFNQADQELRSGGYQITTTIDRDVHTALNQTVNEQGHIAGQPKELTITDENGQQQTVTYPAQVAATMIDNDTGQVLGFVGGRDYDYSEFNIPFDTRRSTGSAIKPLTVFGPALAEQIITPATIVPDTEYSVPSYENGQQTEHEITNYGDTTNEWRTAREWLVRSQNIPTTKIYMEMLNSGSNPAPYLRRMGIGTNAISDEEIAYPSTALGGYSGGPTVTEVVGAYAGIANGGSFNEPYVIQSIEDENGEVIYEYSNEETQIWNEAANYLLLDMLRGTTGENGTASNIPDLMNFETDMFSKTGTSNEYRDLWYVASTPAVSFGLWTGYDNQIISMTDDYDTHPSVRNRELWAHLINSVHSVDPEIVGADQSFPDQPSTVTEEEVLAGTGMKSGEVQLPNDETADVTGETSNELFEENNVPSTTTYDFAVGATEEELNQFWDQYQNDGDSDNGEDGNDITSAISDFLNQLFGEENEENDENNDENDGE